MSEKTYSEARAKIFAAPMTTARWQKLPEWLTGHLTNLLGHLDDAYIDLETSRKAVQGLQNQLDHIKADEPYDHTLANSTRSGRYEGDYYASLQYEPMRDDKYRWLVEVGVWRELRYTAQGHREGLVDRDYWAVARKGIFEEFEAKRFKTSERAIAYLLKVRAVADAGVIRKRLKDIGQDQATQIA